MAEDEKQLRIKILLEEYHTVCDEIKMYVQETTRCLAFGAVLAGLYLGWGTGSSSNPSDFSIKVREFVPYALVILVIYFLSIVYIRLGLCHFRSILENKINIAAGSTIMSFESEFLKKVQSRAYLRLGKSWYARLPTPMLLLGFLVAAAFFVLYLVDKIGNQKYVVLSLLSVCAIVAAFVFFGYPRLLEYLTKKGKI